MKKSENNLEPENGTVCLASNTTLLFKQLRKSLQDSRTKHASTEKF